MAKFHGCIGYTQSTQETSSGVYTENIVEREYRGDILREAKQWSGAAVIHDNLTVQHRISILADDFATSQLSAMRYVKWGVEYWSISKVEIDRPRLILTLSEVYNGLKPVVIPPVEEPGEV
jgi:hypothetical protein